MANDETEVARWGRHSVVALLPAVAVVLGGSTSKWAEGIVVALLGVCLLWQPPRFSLGGWTNAVFLGFAICALAAFLPASLFPGPDWRRMLTSDLGILLPNSVTPQPWLTFGCFVSLIAALAWLYLVSTQELELRMARFELRIFAGAMVALAALSIFFYLAHHSLPFWHGDRGFGPFSNRNQTADLFGLASLVVLAAGQDDIRSGRKRWLFWTVGLLTLVSALVLNEARAGIVILVLGSAFWMAIVAMRTGAAVRIALTASLLLLILGLVLVGGSEALGRFHLGKLGGLKLGANLQWPVFHDTWQLIRNSLWCGLGLSNFESISAIFGDIARGGTRTLSPQSDWLWAWAEMGPLALVFIFAGGVLLLRRIWPLDTGTNQRFRLAALIGGILFALHGLIDVSAHVVGTAYSALFLFGLALHRPLPLRSSRWLPWFFRILGVALFGMGGAWTVSSRTMALLPGASGVDNSKQLARMDRRGRNFREAINVTTQGLAWAPLDWELYYLRAAAEVSARAPSQLAIDDFRRARFLEPNAVSVPLEEGIAWSSVNPSLSFIAWREALRRAGPERPEIFGRIFFEGAVANPNGRDFVEQLAFSYPELTLTYLRQLPAPDFRKALERYLLADPELGALPDAGKRDLLSLWQLRGDDALLKEALLRHPSWQRWAWRALAQEHANAGEFQLACQLMQENGGQMTLPPEITGRSETDLQTEAFRGTTNVAAGYALYRAQMKRGANDDALATVRHFTEVKSAPAYFYFLEAQAAGAKGDWEQSWKAWLNYEKAADR